MRSPLVDILQEAYEFKSLQSMEKLAEDSILFTWEGKTETTFKLETTEAREDCFTFVNDYWQKRKESTAQETVRLGLCYLVNLKADNHEETVLEELPPLPKDIEQLRTLTSGLFSLSF